MKPRITTKRPEDQGEDAMDFVEHFRTLSKGEREIFMSVVYGSFCSICWWDEEELGRCDCWGSEMWE